MEAFTHPAFRFGLLRVDGHDYDCDCHGHRYCCSIAQGSRHDELKPESPSHSTLPTLRACEHTTSSSLTLLEPRVLQPWFRPRAVLPRTRASRHQSFLTCVEASLSDYHRNSFCSHFLTTRPRQASPTHLCLVIHKFGYWNFTLDVGKTQYHVLCHS